MARKNPALVSTNTEFEYTAEMLSELSKCAKDPIYFIRKYVKIQHATQGCIPFSLYDYQEDMIQTIQDNRQTIVTISRQAGKTQCLSAYALWYACFHSDKTILIVSNKNANAMEFIKRTTYSYEMLPNWLKPAVDPQMWTKHELGFANHSRIISQATTEGSGRGLSISLLIADELAFVKPAIAEEFWASISPTLSTGGKAAIISTPNGDVNLFATLFRGAESGSNGMVHRKYDWHKVPHLTEEFIANERAKLGDLKVRQEYFVEFLSSEELLISSTTLADLTEKMRLLPETNSRNNVVFFEPISTKGVTYVVGIDPSKGVGNDFHAIQVMRVTDDGKVVQVAEYRSNDLKTAQLYVMVKRLLQKLAGEHMVNQVFFTFENNAVGEGLMALYQNDPDVMSLGNAYLASDKGQVGMNTNGRTKIRACLILKDLVESGRMSFFSSSLLREMKTYVRERGSYAAQYGSTDDLISAALLCVRIVKDHVSQYDMNAFNAIHSYDEEFSEHDMVFLPSIL